MFVSFLQMHVTPCSTPLRKWSDNKVFSFKMSCYLSLHPLVDHFTVVCVVAWPLNEGGAGVELFVLETFQHLCQWCCSHAYISKEFTWNAVRFLSKWDQPQPHFHSGAVRLSAEQWNGLLRDAENESSNFVSLTYLGKLWWKVWFYGCQGGSIARAVRECSTACQAPAVS